MYIFLTITCIVFSLLIIVNDKQSRFLLFFVAITFLPYGFELSYKLIAPRILVFAFLVSILIRSKEISLIKEIPCRNFLLLVFLSYLLTGFFDHRFGFFQEITKSLTMFFETFGGIILGYVSCNLHTERKTRKCFIVLAYIISLYSLLCIAIGSDPYSWAIGESDSMQHGRMRVASFFFNSHMAGLAMSIYLLVLLYFKQKYKFTILQNIAILLLFIALLLTASRSSLLDFMAGCLVLYFSFLKQSKMKFKYILTGCFVLFCLYVTIGQTVYDKFADAFQDDGGATGGSNVAMRLQQLAFSWMLFLKSPWFGNGFNYFWEEIKVKDNYLSSMLLGAESYVFILLIERGIIQIITICLYFVSLFRFFLNRKSLESNLCIAILTAFLVNSITTGNTYKWIFVMPFVGYYMRYVQLNIKSK